MMFPCFDRNLLLFVVTVQFLPRFVSGFALVHRHHRPLSAPLSTRKIIYRNRNFDVARYRFGSPPQSPPISVQQQRQQQQSNFFSFGTVTTAAIAVTTTTSGSEGEGENTRNKKLLLPERNGNSTNGTAEAEAENKASTTTNLSAHPMDNSLSHTNTSTTNNIIQCTSSGGSSDADTEESWGSSVIASYFPFLRKSKTTTLKVAETVFADNTKNRSKNNNSSNSSSDDSASAILKKQANDPITVADMEILMKQIQSTSNPSIATPARMKVVPKRFKKMVPTRDLVTDGSNSEKTKNLSFSSSSQVAFPQLSEVTQNEIQRGTGIAGCFLGMIVGITILPNLWLVGMVAGLLYGFEITRVLAEGEQPPVRNAIANFLMKCGTQLAKSYRKAADGGKALWFLYKTGQLSYEYYKSYETLDRKFAIQSKVDTWNKVFVKGKRKFDAWEQQNEVGRKVLAGLRTAWLLEEESQMRAAGRSKYRVVQMVYDLRRSANRLRKRAIELIRTLFAEGELQAFCNGLRTELQKKGSLSCRLGSIGAAMAAINIFGAMFSLSLVFSNLLAISLAVIWPSWTTELISRAQEIWVEIQSGASNGYRKKNNSSEGLVNPLEFLQRLYEDHSSDNMRLSKQRKQRSYILKRKPKPVFAKRTPRKKPTKRQAKAKRFGFGFGRNRRQGRKGRQEIGTWGNFKRTS